MHHFNIFYKSSAFKQPLKIILTKMLNYYQLIRHLSAIYVSNKHFVTKQMSLYL